MLLAPDRDLSNTIDEQDDIKEQILKISSSEMAHLLFLNIGLCNDVVVIESKRGPEYHGSSTDEIALLEMARKCGYVMTKRFNDNIFLRTINDASSKFPVNENGEIMYKVI